MQSHADAQTFGPVCNFRQHTHAATALSKLIRQQSVRSVRSGISRPFRTSYETKDKPILQRAQAFGCWTTAANVRRLSRGDWGVSWLCEGSPMETMCVPDSWRVMARR